MYDFLSVAEYQKDQFRTNKTIYQQLIQICNKHGIKDIKYSGSIYNLLFIKDSNISFEGVYQQASSIENNREFFTKVEKAFSNDAFQLISKQIKQNLIILKLQWSSYPEKEIELQIRSPHDKSFPYQLFFKRIIQDIPAFKPLFFIVKSLIKNYGLSEPKNNFVNNNIIISMLLTFLQY